MTSLADLNAIAAKLVPLGRRLQAQLNRLRECDHCGWQMVRPPIKQSLGGIMYVAPGQCEPSEYVEVCPECGAIESFQDERVEA